MEQSHDMDFVGGDLVAELMLTDQEASITGAQFVSGATQVRVVAEPLKGLVKSRHVAVALSHAPGQ